MEKLKHPFLSPVLGTCIWLAYKASSIITKEPEWKYRSCIQNTDQANDSVLHVMKDYIRDVK